jgi:hypothetical protein
MKLIKAHGAVLVATAEAGRPQRQTDSELAHDAEKSQP